MLCNNPSDTIACLQAIKASIVPLRTIYFILYEVISMSQSSCDVTMAMKHKFVTDNDAIHCLIRLEFASALQFITFHALSIDWLRYVDT